MAAEERKHVLFWKNAIRYSEENTIPDIFENETNVHSDLKKSKALALKLLESIEYGVDSRSFLQQHTGWNFIYCIHL